MKPPTERQLRQARHAARHLWRDAVLLKKVTLTPYQRLMLQRVVRGVPYTVEEVLRER